MISKFSDSEQVQRGRRNFSSAFFLRIKSDFKCIRAKARGACAVGARGWGQFG
jgi:hypothetical protein